MPNLLNPYRNAAVGPPFSPADIAGLTAWYDFSDSSTVTTVGSAITQIADKVLVNPVAMVQALAPEQPSVGTINGLGAASCSGDRMNAAAANAKFSPGASSYTIGVVFERSGVGGFGGLASLGEVGAGFTTVFLPSGGNDANFNAFNGAAFQTPLPLATSGETYSDGNAHLLLCSRNAAGGTTQIVDETGTVRASATFSGSINTNQFATICGIFRPPTSFNEPFTGLIGEVVYYQSFVTGTDQSDLISYFTTKWGI